MYSLKVNGDLVDEFDDDLTFQNISKINKRSPMFIPEVRVCMGYECLVCYNK